MLHPNVIYYGSPSPLPTPRGLRAGPLTLNYEEGSLRGIYYGRHQLVQRIYMAVRDRSWGTVPNSISEERIEADAASFRIAYHVESRQDELHFRWDALLTGSEDGTISFSFEGEAITEFLQSRIGFCILHPMFECMERSCLVTRADGPPRTGTFPRHIVATEPLEPFAEMTGMTYEPAPGIKVDLRFTGDLFEMEDQRNWTDASYKTFCTPLRLGCPHLISAGTRVAQSVTMRVMGIRGQTIVSSQTAQPVTLAIGADAPKPLPQIGLGAASHGGVLTGQEIARLRTLDLAHLRLDVIPSRAGWQNVLRRVEAEASALGVPLEAALLLSNNAEAELRGLAALVSLIRPRLLRWLVFHKDEPVPSRALLKLARQTLAHCSPNVPVGSGTNANFYELNVARPPVEVLDFVTYSINPQSHAFDNASLVETLSVQAVTAATARQFVGDKPLVVSAITFKVRYNPYETGPGSIRADVLPPQVDARQMSLFGAGWTLGSIKYLAECGEVSSLTYYETTGWRGVIDTESGSPLPEQFPALPGKVFPLYHVLAAVGEFAGGEVLRIVSSNPANVEALALRKGTRLRLLITNFTMKQQHVIVNDLPARARCKRLDEKSIEKALALPEEFRAQPGEAFRGPEVTLLPYSTAILDADLGI